MVIVKQFILILTVKKHDLCDRIFGFVRGIGQEILGRTGGLSRIEIEFAGFFYRQGGHIDLGREQLACLSCFQAGRQLYVGSIGPVAGVRSGQACDFQHCSGTLPVCFQAGFGGFEGGRRRTVPDSFQCVFGSFESQPGLGCGDVFEGCFGDVQASAAGSFRRVQGLPGRLPRSCIPSRFARRSRPAWHPPAPPPFLRRRWQSTAFFEASGAAYLPPYRTASGALRVLWKAACLPPSRTPFDLPSAA